MKKATCYGQQILLTSLCPLNNVSQLACTEQRNEGPCYASKSFRNLAASYFKDSSFRKLFVLDSCQTAVGNAKTVKLHAELHDKKPKLKQPRLMDLKPPSNTCYLG